LLTEASETKIRLPSHGVAGDHGLTAERATTMVRAVTPGASNRPKADGRVGQTLNGKWLIERVIDVGGMATVYEARHRNGRRAAIKVLHPSSAANPEMHRRFLREGYAANKIGHPGAVAILDDEVAEDGSPFLVMELLEGHSLSGRLAQIGGKLPFAETLGITGQVLEVLDMAHANGIIHRDVKPGNIFVTNTGHAKLLDFGLARIRDGVLSSVPTLTGIVMGTAGYLAPEQARGQPDEVDPRTDIFAVGAVMFRAIAGRTIHDQPNPMDALIAAMKDPAPKLADVVPGAAPALAAVVDRALAFEKTSRWRSAREMREALRGVYASLQRRPPMHALTAAGGWTGDGAGPPISVREDDAPSLVAEVAFGDHRDEALAQERKRTNEIIEAMASEAVARE
jgi:serine/threonine protein kinase